MEKIEITKFCSRLSSGYAHNFFYVTTKYTNIKVYSKFYELYDVEECRVFLYESSSWCSRMNGLPERHLNFFSPLTLFMRLVSAVQHVRHLLRAFRKSLRHHSHWLRICLHACFFFFSFFLAIFPFYVA